MTQWKLGIIGGSGLYGLHALQSPQWHNVETPWGSPSDALLTGRIGDTECVFLPRHGRGHTIPPGELNFRANIAAMKQLGVTDLISVSAVGSLDEAIAPGHFVVADQFIDRTVSRAPSFFGSGLVAHVSMADPVCPRLSGQAADAARAAGVTVHLGATYLAMEGPQFSTRAESRLYRNWGAQVIGMTAMPEARLAREAELPYALVGMVTDYDCWKQDEAPVEVSAVLARLAANAETARRMVQMLVERLPEQRTPSPIDTVLDMAIVTHPDHRDPVAVAQLDRIAGRALAR